jgi:hypothetical protein
MQLFLASLVTVFGDVLDEDYDYIVVEAAQFDRAFGPFAEGEHIDRLQLIAENEELWLNELVLGDQDTWEPKRAIRVQLGEYK